MTIRVLVSLLLCGAFVTGSVARAETTLIDPDRVFSRAAEAYENGDFDRAADLYEQLIEAGYDDKSVTFNLGNSYFRTEDVGRAVLNYRRAWHVAPRDADILTNLKHLQDNAHLVSPETSPWQRILQRVQPGEWAICFSSALWASALFFIASMYVTQRATQLRRAALISLLLLVVAGSGLWHWHGFSKTVEAVVIAPNQQAKYGPIVGAKPHFDVPPGTIVRIREKSPGWLRISLNKKSGWLQESACSTVRP